MIQTIGLIAMFIFNSTRIKSWYNHRNFDVVNSYFLVLPSKVLRKTQTKTMWGITSNFEHQIAFKII